MLRQFAGKLDLCCIPTAHHWHGPMTLDALKAGAGVLVEKPMSVSLDEAAAITETAEKAGRQVAVGFQDAYTPESHALKRRLLEEAIGEIRGIRCWAVWPRPDSYYARNNWAGRREAGGRPVLDSPVSNALAHPLNLCLFFAGDAFEAWGVPRDIEARLLRGREVENFDTALIRLAAGSVPDIRYAVTHAGTPLRNPRIEILGERGRAVWNIGEDSFIEAEGAPAESLGRTPDKEKRDHMLDAVTARLREGAGFVCRAADAAHHVAVVAALGELPIETVLRERVRDVPNKHGDRVVAIEGIAEELRAFCEEG